jgi:hypothetical protein
VWGMMAGATTQASSAIGAVTEAQMAKIFFSEYCLELAGASTWAGSDCVLVMSLSVAVNAGSAHRPSGSRSPRRVRLTGDADIRL